MITDVLDWRSVAFQFVFCLYGIIFMMKSSKMIPGVVVYEYCKFIRFFYFIYFALLV